jgi:hypothetical protein
MLPFTLIKYLLMLAVVIWLVQIGLIILAVLVALFVLLIIGSLLYIFVASTADSIRAAWARRTLRRKATAKVIAPRHKRAK